MMTVMMETASRDDQSVVAELETSALLRVKSRVEKKESVNEVAMEPQPRALFPPPISFVSPSPTFLPPPQPAPS